MNRISVKNVLEAILLSTPDPISIETIKSVFSEGFVPTEGMIRQAVEAINQDYEGKVLEIQETRSGYRFVIDSAMMPFIERLMPEKKIRVTKAMMETLAMIAYEQPVTRGDIENVRGVSVGTNTIRALQDLSWIEIVGLREVPGRPALYSTTSRFLDDFGLKGLEDLPNAKSFIENPLNDLLGKSFLDPKT